VADPNSGVWIYDSAAGGWIVVGGTSLATPVMAGITNAQGTFRLSSNAELTNIYNIYGNQSVYTDITSGGCHTHRATARFDWEARADEGDGPHPGRLLSGEWRTGS
jgi:hypothetical protein